MIETLDGLPPADGSEPLGAGEGQYGIDDSMRLGEIAKPGMALSRIDSAAAANRRTVYKFGNALARPEFYAVLTTKGPAPAMDVPATTTNANGVEVLYAGYAPVLLAPGEVIKVGDALEPINGGTYAAHWRKAPSGCGPAFSRDSLDNSAGDAVAAWVGADIFGGNCCPAGVLGAVGPSANLTGVTVETAYGLPAAATITIPAYSLRVGDRLRIVGAVLSNNIAAGNNTVKGYIDGIGSGALFTAAATTFAANDVVQFSIDLYIAAASGASNASMSGHVAAGAPGTATYRPVAGLLTLDLTTAQTVTITNTPNNIADSSKLLFLSVEKL